jgi:hypothetical protein
MDDNNNQDDDAVATRLDAIQQRVTLCEQKIKAAVDSGLLHAGPNGQLLDDGDAAVSIAIKGYRYE